MYYHLVYLDCNDDDDVTYDKESLHYPYAITIHKTSIVSVRHPSATFTFKLIGVRITRFELYNLNKCSRSFSC